MRTRCGGGAETRRPCSRNARGTAPPDGGTRSASGTHGVAVFRRRAPDDRAEDAAEVALRREAGALRDIQQRGRTVANFLACELDAAAAQKLADRAAEMRAELRRQMGGLDQRPARTASRYSDGVRPTIVRKTRLKWLCGAKPARCATSSSEAAPLRISSHANSMRRRRRNSPTVQPKCARNCAARWGDSISVRHARRRGTPTAC